MSPIDGSAGSDEKTVLFEVMKQRGDNVRLAAYAYAGEGGISYEERLASVRLVDAAKTDAFQKIEAKRADRDVIAIVAACITEGIVKKMDLTRAVASRAKVSERSAIQIIESYTGDDPAKHHWTFTVVARGAKVFELLAPAVGASATADPATG